VLPHNLIKLFKDEKVSKAFDSILEKNIGNNSTSSTNGIVKLGNNLYTIQKRNNKLLYISVSDNRYYPFQKNYTLSGNNSTINIRNLQQVDNSKIKKIDQSMFLKPLFKVYDSTSEYFVNRPIINCSPLSKNSYIEEKDLLGSTKDSERQWLKNYINKKQSKGYKYNRNAEYKCSVKAKDYYAFDTVIRPEGKKIVKIFLKRMGITDAKESYYRTSEW